MATSTSTSTSSTTSAAAPAVNAVNAVNAVDPNLRRALDTFTLGWEGRVYEDVPGDPGGPTRWGITWKDANAYLKEHGRPLLSSPTAVKDLPEDDIRAIYGEHYWTPLQCATICQAGHYGVALVLFDAAVNVGVSRSAQWLQRILGTAPDGVMGPKTLAATLNYINLHGGLSLIQALLTRRREYYQDLAQSNPALGKFLKGWLSRVNALDQATRSLAAPAKG